MMNVKNPQYNFVGTIDLEIEHPDYGWIPFTASPNDSEEIGRSLYAQAIAGDFGEISAYIEQIPSAIQNKAEAERRLNSTDWVNQPDVYDPANTPHLMNRDSFIAYRSQVRAIAVNPIDGKLDWPVEPTAVWSS